jgi:hypothetical protein
MRTSPRAIRSSLAYPVNRRTRRLSEKEPRGQPRGKRRIASETERGRRTRRDPERRPAMSSAPGPSGQAVAKVPAYGYRSGRTLRTVVSRLCGESGAPTGARGRHGKVSHGQLGRSADLRSPGRSADASGGRPGPVRPGALPRSQPRGAGDRDADRGRRRLAGDGRSWGLADLDRVRAAGRRRGRLRQWSLGGHAVGGWLGGLDHGSGRKVPRVRDRRPASDPRLARLRPSHR